MLRWFLVLQNFLSGIGRAGLVLGNPWRIVALRASYYESCCTCWRSSYKCRFSSPELKKLLESEKTTWLFCVCRLLLVLQAHRTCWVGGEAPTCKPWYGSSCVVVGALNRCMFSIGMRGSVMTVKWPIRAGKTWHFLMAHATAGILIRSLLSVSVKNLDLACTIVSTQCSFSARV